MSTSAILCAKSFTGKSLAPASTNKANRQLEKSKKPSTPITDFKKLLFKLFEFLEFMIDTFDKISTT